MFFLKLMYREEVSSVDRKKRRKEESQETLTGWNLSVCFPAVVTSSIPRSPSHSMFSDACSSGQFVGSVKNKHW